MKNIKNLILLFIVSFLFFSCGKESDADNVLVGTFKVTKVEGQRYFNGNPDFYLVDNNPTGNIKFNKNGTGKQDYSFTVLGNKTVQNSNFSWTANASIININRYNEPDLIWERIINEKNKQVAAYDIIVDAQTKIKYTLTLEK